MNNLLRIFTIVSILIFGHEQQSLCVKPFDRQSAGTRWFETPQAFHQAVEERKKQEEYVRNALIAQFDITPIEDLQGIRRPSSIGDIYCCKCPNEFSGLGYPRHGGIMFYRSIADAEVLFAIARGRLEEAAAKKNNPKGE